MRVVRERFIYVNGEKTKYTVDEDGRIYSKISNRHLKPFANKCGYQLVDISHGGKRYTMQVHRLVAIAFIPNPKNLPTVNHKDGNKSNNAVYNLEWMSRVDNVRHAWSTGLANPRFGTDNPANTYTEEQVRYACELMQSRKYTYADISRMTGITKTTLYDMRCRGKWSKITCEYDLPKDIFKSPYHEYREQILKLIHEGIQNKDIIELLNLPVRAKRYVEHLRYKIKTASTTISDGRVHP